MKRPDGVILLAIYHFVIGITLLIGACAILAFTIPAVAVYNNNVNSPIVTLFFSSLALLISGLGGLLALIAGAGLLALKEWARWLALGIAIISLIAFPIGTIIGGITIWYLLQEHVKAAFIGGRAPTQGVHPPAQPISPTPAAPIPPVAPVPENPIPENPPAGMEAAEAGMDATRTEAEAPAEFPGEESFGAAPTGPEVVETSAVETVVSGSAFQEPEIPEHTQVEPAVENENDEPETVDLSSVETRVGNLPSGEVVPSEPPAINATFEDNVVEQDETGFASAEIAADENETVMTEWHPTGARIYETPSSKSEETGIESQEPAEEEPPSEDDEIQT
jgi:hypothetical protein